MKDKCSERPFGQPALSASPTEPLRVSSLPGNDQAQNLLALAEWCENANGPDRDLDALIGRIPVAKFLGLPFVEVEPARGCVKYTASLDAALSLVPERCTTDLATQDRHSLRWKWELRDFRAVRHSARAATPALAICAAALRARAATQPKDPS